jgi:hypothetical protein
MKNVTLVLLVIHLVFISFSQQEIKTFKVAEIANRCFIHSDQSNTIQVPTPVI